MTTRKRGADNNANSGRREPKRNRGAATAPSPVAAASSGATTAAAAAVAAVEPSTDKRGESKTATTPDALYAEGMEHLRMSRCREAMSCLLRAAECNHVEAASYYANLLFRMNSLSESETWYQRVLLLVRGHSKEAVLSARAYRGLGQVFHCRGSWQHALPYFHQGALLNDPKCQYHLGVYLDEGRSLPRDARAAYHWYRLAAAAGSRRSAVNLGFPLSLLRTPTPAPLAQ